MVVKPRFSVESKDLRLVPAALPSSRPQPKYSLVIPTDERSEERRDLHFPAPTPMIPGAECQFH